MDISQEMLIDLALNILSFLIAGILSVMLYSIYQKKQSKLKKNQPNKTLENITLPDKEEMVINNKSSAEYIQFNTKDNNRIRNITGRGNITRFNNRDMVLESALNMISRGVSESKIKAALPISSAELAVLGLKKDKQ